MKVSCSLAMMLALATLNFASASTITGIAVYPPDVNLNSKPDFQRYLVIATRPDGVTLEVTAEATATLADGQFARLENQTVYPVADGTTTLNVEFQGHKAAAPVTVVNSATDRPVSFHVDVMPVFMRASCNVGSCHGSARGKDGFRLSLYGFDPKGDYLRLTREESVRRINLAVPEDSLLIEKAIGAVPHSGGKLFEKDSTYCQTLLRWLEAGAPIDSGQPPQVVKMEIYPPRAVIEGAGTNQRFITRAFYSDGHDRDVTDLTRFTTSNDNSAPVDINGLVTAGARGEAFVMGRFETETVGSQVLVLPKDLQYTAPEITGNYIDQLVGAKLMKVRVLPSALCGDEEFLRRA
ncbi:MAG: cell surface protein, partial [Planctomycetes bacterium]|nr:cell surface protein [Planctomycetota bacterium]